MADDLLQQRQTASARQRAVTVALTVVISALAGASAVLWAYYGTAVFFQTIAAGIAACF